MIAGQVAVVSCSTRALAGGRTRRGAVALLARTRGPVRRAARSAANAASSSTGPVFDNAPRLLCSPERSSAKSDSAQSEPSARKRGWELLAEAHASRSSVSESSAKIAGTAPVGAARSSAQLRHLAGRGLDRTPPLSGGSTGWSAIGSLRAGDRRAAPTTWVRYGGCDQRDVVVVVRCQQVDLLVLEDEQRFFFGLFRVGFVGVLLGVEARARFFGAEDADSLDGRTFVVVQVAHVFLNINVLTVKG